MRMDILQILMESMPAPVNGGDMVFSVSWMNIIAVCGWITVVGGAVFMIIKLWQLIFKATPTGKLKDLVDQHSEYLANDKMAIDSLGKDVAELKERRSEDQKHLKEIDNNLKETKEEILGAVGDLKKDLNFLGKSWINTTRYIAASVDDASNAEALNKEVQKMTDHFIPSEHNADK